MVDRITLTGIRPYSNSIGPSGNHLRWTFPEHLGFPPGGFQVYRRRVSTPECLEKHISKIQINSNSPTKNVSFEHIGSVEFKIYDNSLIVINPKPELLQLHFTEPVAFVSLELNTTDSILQYFNIPLKLSAYAGSQLVATSSNLNTAGRVTLQVSAPYITRVTIPLLFEALHNVCYLSVPNTEECSNGNWKSIIHIPLCSSIDEALGRLKIKPWEDKPLVGKQKEKDGLYNRYAPKSHEGKPDPENAINHYQPELEQLVTYLNLLQHPTKEIFDDLNVSPDQLRLKKDPEIKPSLQNVAPQSILLLAALDPNIARMLGLYWVDKELTGGTYDYKVEGKWGDNRDVGCGLLLGQGAQKSDLPFVNEPLEGNQLPGLRWGDTGPLGRVGLRWPRPAKGQGAVQPVLFDIFRDDGRGKLDHLTQESPVLVPSSAWEQPDTALFIDTDVPMGEYSYQLRPIDIFGQVGEAITSEPIKVQDLEVPPPPIRLRAALTQPGYPWHSPVERNEPNKDQGTVELYFEYGDAQYRQAPDAKNFRCYWRAESLFENCEVAVDKIVSEEELPDGATVYTVQLKGVTSEKLSAFTGGVLTKVKDDNASFPGNERRKYHIADIVAQDKLQLLLAPTHNAITPGDSYQLLSDPRQRTNWHFLNLEIRVQPPLKGMLRKKDSEFQALGVQVEVLSPKGDPLAMLPAGQQPQALAEPSSIVEVLLDRALLEPNLFDGGTLRVDGQSNEIPILYSTSGPSFNKENAATAARVGLPPGTQITENSSLTLIAAKTDKGSPQVQALTIKPTLQNRLLDVAKVPGGEIAFDITPRNGETRTYEARVVSDAKANNSGTFDVLVRLSNMALTNLYTGITVRYYTPYLVIPKVNFTNAGSGGGNADTLHLSIPPGQTSQNAYLSVSTLDLRGNESPLSSPVQVTAVSPPPVGAPSQPYPCNQDSGAEAGYATPPDRQGHATVCLTWDTGDLNPSRNLRYEVARALDNGILAAHRRNWLLGKADVAETMKTKEPLKGNLDAVHLDQKSGLYRLKTNIDLAGENPAVFRGGRLSQGDRHFQITAVASNEKKLELVVRPMIQNADGPATGEVTLYAPPDYSEVKNNFVALQGLAKKNPEAFGLATGVPVAVTIFIDEIPGIGRNRYFYRVRAVDASENRSDWSEVSVPFHQVDTTQPEPPVIDKPHLGDRAALLVWEPSTEQNLAGYRIYRAEGDAAPQVRTTAPIATLDGTTDMPLLAIAGSLTLPQAVTVNVDATLSLAEVRVVVANQVKVQEAGTASPNLFDPESGQVIFSDESHPDGSRSARVSGLRGLAETAPATPLSITIGEQIVNTDPRRCAWRDQDVRGGKIYSYVITAVKKVYMAPAGQDKKPRELLLESEPSAPMSVTAVDLSTPAPPTLDAVEWVVENGPTDTGDVTVVRLQVSAATTTAQLLLQRQRDGLKDWSSPPVNSKRGWQHWNDVVQNIYWDTTAQADVRWHYRVRLRTDDGRLSDCSEIVTLDPLPLS